MSTLDDITEEELCTLMDAKLEGKITHVNSNGFGFIRTKNNIDFFLHHSNFKGDWKKLILKFVNNEEIIVLFDSDPAATDGPRAINAEVK